MARGLNQLVAGLASQLGQIQDQGLVAGEAEPAAEEEKPDEQPEAEAEAEGESPEAEETDGEASAQADTNPPEPDAAAEDSGGTDQEEK